jgi:hypothetical protein
VTVEAVGRSRQLAVDLAELQEDWLDQARHPRADSTAARLIRALPGQPILDARTVATTLEVSEVAARNALNGLESAGLIRPTVFGASGRLIEGLLRADLIIVDDLGFAPLDDTGAQLLFRARTRGGGPPTTL